MNKQERIVRAKQVKQAVENRAPYEEVQQYYGQLTDPVENEIRWPTEVEIYNEDVVDRVMQEADPVIPAKVGVMNFASARRIGGGFLTGSNAQEENLCMASNLYNALSEDPKVQGYYEYHNKNKSHRYSDRAIYSPDVRFGDMVNGNPENFVAANVLTIAAPNVKAAKKDPTGIEARADMKLRILQALRIFKEDYNDVIILGAFGCGVFGNDPKTVAEIFREWLGADEFYGFFKRVIFSVYDNSPGQRTYKAFDRTLRGVDA